MNPDDPKFTAHALGEFEDLTPAERAEIESLLAADPHAMSEAEDLKALAARLRAELPGEEAGALNEDQRAAVLSMAGASSSHTPVVPFPRRPLGWALALAACVAVAGSAAFVLPALRPAKDAARAVALATVVEMQPFEVPPAPEVQLTPPPIMPDVMLALEPPASEASLVSPAPSVPPAPQPRAAPAPTAASPLAVASEKPDATLEPGPVRLSLRTTTPVQLPPQPPLEAATVPRSVNSGKAPLVRSFSTTQHPSDAELRQTIALESRLVMTTQQGGMSTVMLRSENADASSSVIVPTTPPSSRAAAATLIEGFSYAPPRAPDDGAFGEPFDPEPSRTTSFELLAENGFLRARPVPLSTFSIDVDTASYAIVRRFLTENRPPPKASVRIEELINYFTYDYSKPEGETPFSAAMEVADCPWKPDHRLVRIGLKGREMANDQRPASNLVFLIDVSGSMRPENKLPLLKRSLGMLIDQLGGEDQVAMVVYAGTSGCVLEATNDKRKMRAALSRLEAGGSTNGGSGVQLAYRLAEKSFIKGGTNRVILATDGDWNVGVTNRDDLLDLIKRKAQGGVFLTVLGLGMDNLKDSMLVKLADSGNGNYAYLDTDLEARKVLIEQLSGTLVTIAKDVKIQVEFNPTQVSSYRLIGYEKRMLKKEDFSNDKKDAGEIGAGHTVTALYEVVPVGRESAVETPARVPLKYQPETGTPVQSGGVNRDPGEIFVSAYLMVQAGEKAEMSGDLYGALVKYTSAEATLKLLAEQSAEWQPQILRYRLSRTAASIAAVQKKLAQSNTVVDQGPAKPSPPIAQPAAVKPEDEMRPAPAPATEASKEMLTLKIRYKEPEGETSKLLEFPLTDGGAKWEQSSTDFRFAAAVAGYGMLLRDSAYKGDLTWNSVTEWAQEGKGKDTTGYRAEFLSLVEKARAVCR